MNVTDVLPGAREPAPLPVGRQRLSQLSGEPMRLVWRELPDSDSERHPGCGYIPTGRECPACGGFLGSELASEYSYQEDFLADDHLTVMGTGGEQAGKSNSVSMKAFGVILAFLGQYAGSGRAAGEVAWLVADNYELTAQEFGNLRDWLRTTPFKVRASKRVDPGEITVRVPGGDFIVKTRSSDSTQSLRAESPVVVMVCEAALVSPDAYERLRSRVGRARSMFPGYGAILLSGTLEGSLGWYPTLLTKWKSPAVQEAENVASFSMPSFSNIFAYQGGANDPAILEIAASISETAYKERVLAIPAPPTGRVHHAFDPTVHVQMTEYDPEEPVYIGIDPGYSGRSSTYAVEVAQRRPVPCLNHHFWVTHEIFEKEMTAEQICDMTVQQTWWKSKLKTAVVDVAGVAHAGAMESNVEVWLKKTGLVLLNQKVNIRPGIDRFDSMLSVCAACGEPYLVFDPKCRGVISELGGATNPFDGQIHVYSWQKDRSGSVVGGNPRDEYCDGIKALTYLFVNQFGYATANQERRRIKVKRRRDRRVYA
jgi:hypothetical protein